MTSDFVHPRDIEHLLKPGDLLEFRRSTYSHWAVYLGEEDGLHMLMHYWRRGGIQSDREWEELFGDFTGGESSAEIRKDDLYKVAGKSNKVRINNEHDDHMTVLPVDEILMRAYSRMDEAKYNLATNNCEHFVVWCRYGTNYSKQASKVKMSVANMAISAFAGQEYANQVTGWVEQNLPTIASVIPTLFDEKTSPL